jgi:hypothetical protein
VKSLGQIAYEIDGKWMDAHPEYKGPMYGGDDWKHTNPLAKERYEAIAAAVAEEAVKRHIADLPAVLPPASLTPTWDALYGDMLPAPHPPLAPSP